MLRASRRPRKRSLARVAPGASSYWQTPFLQFCVQQFLSSLQAAPDGSHAWQTPWKQMLVQQSPFPPHVTAGGLQLPSHTLLGLQ